MRTRIVNILFMLSVASYLHAIPAKPGGAKVRQPDGGTLTLVLHGDEYHHFTTTSDGYTVVKAGAEWQYALPYGGSLKASGMAAHDEAARSMTEKSFVGTLDKMAVPAMSPDAKAARSRARSLWGAAGSDEQARRGTRYDYGNFRGLVILVEWSDLGFTRSDSKEFFSSMINDEGYSGYYMEGGSRKWVGCTGSVRDYFSDNSMGLFKPAFDVVGPVRINRKHTYPSGTRYGAQCAYEALLAADGMVDFSKYDADGDGTVDMFYIIYAGYGSNVSGNNEAYIWPYASSLSYAGIKLDGTRMGRYACSTELCAGEAYGDKTLDGIGTMCHEFSHVLGLPDLYDTDYAENGLSDHPGVWNIMAGGGYLNNSRTPAGYGAYERYAVGFMQPEKVTEKGGSYELEPINTSNKAYRIDSSVDKEFFLLENRQRTRWDSALPGAGMLVSRVDSTDAAVWDNNTLNCNPEHNYYELLRANPKTSNGTVVASGYDPFPGLGNVTEINNETTPSLLSWTGAPTPLSLHSISCAGGVVSFGVGGAEVDKDVEDFEQMSLTSADVTGAKGAFCNWDLVNARIVETTEDYGTGSKALGMVNGGYLTSSLISKAISKVEFDFWNPTNTAAIIVTGYSEDGGKTWKQMETPGGQTQTSVSPGTGAHIFYNNKLPDGSMIRIFMYKGSSSSRVYIDDIKVIYTAGQSSDVSDMLMEKDNTVVSETLYNMSGQRVAAGTKGLLIVKARTADGRTITRKTIRR